MSGTVLLHKELPVADEYDVLVVGAGPAGVCAAVSAAREGARVLLAERYGCVGGMLTSGLIDPILGRTSAGTMYDEVVRRMREIDGDVTVPETRNGREIPVDDETAKTVLNRMIAEAGVTLWLGAAFADAITENGRVSGAIFATQSGLRAVRAKITVDATGDGCVAAAAGCVCSIGRDSDGAIQPMSLEFRIDNVDESIAISAWGGSDPVVIPAGPFAGMEYRQLCRQKNLEGELPRNVTIVRLHHGVHPGSRSVNATQVNGLDPLDPGEIALAELDLREQIQSCLKFLRSYIPGYENCRLVSSASTVGVRESRRVRGIVTIDDTYAAEGVRREDAVVRDAWFLIDIHNPTGGGQAEGFAKAAQPYDIPYGALVPADVGGLLLSGRCISGTHRAHASYRVMAICMAVGEAAGAAAAIAAGTGREPAQIPAEETRAVLTGRGIAL